MNLKKRVVVIIIAALVVLVAVYGFMPKPVMVEAVKVSRADLKVTVEEEGKTRVKDKFTVSSPTSGYMKRLTLQEGDTVKKGKILAVLEPIMPVALDERAREQSEAGVKGAEAMLESSKENTRAVKETESYLKSKLERIKKLYESGYISKDDYELSELDARKTEAQRIASESGERATASEVEKARAMLRRPSEGNKSNEDIIIHSPVSGRILRILKKSEGVVNPGEALMEIGDPRLIEVRVDVLSTDAVNLRPGSKVIFKRWGGDDVLEGKVSLIEPSAFTKVSTLGVEEQRVAVIVRFTSLSKEWTKLGDGYSLEASFIMWEGADVLQIPVSSLFRHGDGWAVFVVENGKAKLRTVQTGRRNGLFAAIVSGLKEGELVVANPEDSVTEGVKVDVRR